MAEEEDVAFRAGDALTEKVHDMVALTNAKLNAKTEKALKDIARSKNILYVLLAIVPLLSLGLATAFIRGVTTPVNRLLEATRSLKSGNLDHKVEGLKEEFGELASSFNEMADSIKTRCVACGRRSKPGESQPGAESCAGADGEGRDAGGPPDALFGDLPRTEHPVERHPEHDAAHEAGSEG
jgi:HAMP domain-containing protein